MAEKVQVDFPEGVSYNTAKLLIAWKIVQSGSTRPGKSNVDEQYIKDTAILFNKVLKTLERGSLEFIEEEPKK